MNRILFLSQDPLLNRMFSSTAQDFSCKMIIESELSKGVEVASNGLCESIIVCVPLMRERCPHKILKVFKDINPHIPVFFILNDLDIAIAISLTKQGAEYCYSRPFSVEDVLEKAQLKSPSLAKVLPKETSGSSDLKYFKAVSAVANHLYEQIDKVADTNFKVIVYGETGTGKESVARRLCSGIYKDRPFVAVDCGCLNRELAASELFGHKKGSFSGAFEDKTGAFQAANNGTIFLDEIGNLDYSVQALLLRAIEEKKIKKIGSNDEIEINVRIIVASNERLSEAVERGTFREDLYYRLNEFEINIPPLRERTLDIEPFIKFFIEETKLDLSKNISGVSQSLMQRLMSYSWPGNLRELKNVIRRGCLMATGELTTDCMADEFMDKINSDYKSRAFQDKFQSDFPENQNDLKQKNLVSEYKEILKVLEEVQYNKTLAALQLNISRKTLYNKLNNFAATFSTVSLA